MARKSPGKVVATLVCCASVAVASAPAAAPVTTDVKLDHFGYRPGDPKVAVFSADPGSTVEVRTTGDIVVLTVPIDGGSIVSKGFDGNPSGDTVWSVDFSILDTPGSYRLHSPDRRGRVARGSTRGSEDRRLRFSATSGLDHRPVGVRRARGPRRDTVLVSR